MTKGMPPPWKARGGVVCSPTAGKRVVMTSEVLLLSIPQGNSAQLPRTAELAGCVVLPEGGRRWGHRREDAAWVVRR